MTNKFDVLVADCPWSYNRKSTGGTNKSGASQKYEAMKYMELLDLDKHILPLMNDNSVCFLWTTVPMLEDALSIMDHWSFEYKTMITWVKRNNGLGNWFRGKTEHLLMGVRGAVKPFRLQAPNLIISEKTLKHSEKPIESYELIESVALRMSHNRDTEILELFARNRRMAFHGLNWTCIGVDITGNDIRTDLQNLVGI
jgi:N6-adenosine-specific RNA methylase IME4